MAATSITVTKMTPEALATMPTAAAVDAKDGALIPWDAADGKLLILIENAASAPKSVTIKSGGGLQGVGDLTLSLSASAKTAIMLDSGKYKQVKGDNKGKLVITGEDANVKVAALQLI